MAEAPCCPPGSLGPAPELAAAQTLRGTVTKIGSIDAYVAEPLPGAPAANATKAVIVSPDIFGLDSGTTKQICDHLSSELGVLVVAPDLYASDPWPEKWGMPTERFNLLWFIPWTRRHRFDTVAPLVQNDVVPYLTSRGVTSWAWMGFCMGATIAATLSQDARCKGGVAAHPAYNAYGISGGPSPAEVYAGFKAPLLVLPAKNDQTEARVTVPELVRKAGHACDVIPFETVVHGFVNRGDPKDPVVGPARAKAIQEATSFFKRVLAI